MSVERSDVLAALARLQLPDGGDLVRGASSVINN